MKINATVYISTLAPGTEYSCYWQLERRTANLSKQFRPMASWHYCLIFGSLRIPAELHLNLLARIKAKDSDLPLNIAQEQHT